MASQNIVFAGSKVALIVRGKNSAEHSPWKLQQHADCVRSNGHPVGYFGAGMTGSGNDSSYNTTSTASSAFYSTSAVFIGISGEVYDLDIFRRLRPFYVDVHQARTYRLLSTALVVQVSTTQANLFDEYWDRLKNDPGTFRLLGKNCSTRASGAFRHAGILPGGIPGLDTPDNLYKQLAQARADLCTSYSGYIGFEETGGNMTMVIESP